MRRIHRMQGRLEYDCSCGDEATRTCGACGERLCRDCILDHECVGDEEAEGRHEERDRQHKKAGQNQGPHKPA